MPTSKADFERLANARLSEAECLFSNGFYDGAFYLAGYAVEFGIKAILCRGIRAQEMPDPDIKDYFVHDLKKLLKYAGLTDEIQGLGLLASSWNLLITKWSEATRYSGWTQAEAQSMIIAVGDSSKGVLPWLRSKW